MNTDAKDFGTLNPHAPQELSRFGFLVGTWRCEARLKLESGSWETLQGTWVGRYELDGYVILDEFRMSRTTGELLVLGLNVRAYDVNKKTWTMKWLNALGGSWTDLGTDELGGVKMGENSVTYAIKEPLATHALTRATYCDISDTHFTWRGERSSDGSTWEEFLVIEANRTD
jgi:hypothetical protein